MGSSALFVNIIWRLYVDAYSEMKDLYLEASRVWPARLVDCLARDGGPGQRDQNVVSISWRTQAQSHRVTTPLIICKCTKIQYACVSRLRGPQTQNRGWKE